MSRVLNASGPVSAATRRRIERAAAQLRYSPNGAARSLITRRTHTLGVLLPDLYGEFFSEVIRGIDQVAQRSGYHMLVSSSHSEQSAFVAALHAMRGRVDGLIVMSPDLDQRTLRRSLASGPPVVLLNCAASPSGFDVIKVDNEGGAAAMTEHLLRLGHRRIAFIRGAESNVDAEERLQGFLRVMHAAGIQRRPHWEIAGDFTECGGYRGTKTLLAERTTPTAIFAANDSMAIGALCALRDAGVDVPGDVAVAGFDDIPIARYTSPPLTSVHVPITQLGERATERLVSAMCGNGVAGAIETLPTTLVIRRSCGERRSARGARTHRADNHLPGVVDVSTARKAQRNAGAAVPHASSPQEART